VKYYLNAMPKSGLHLLDALCKPLTLNRAPLWAGTYTGHGFTTQRKGLELVTNPLCYLPDNYRLIGHSGYDDDLEWYIANSGICHIFMVRDLRDVAVSQAYHVISDDDNLQHPDKDIYRALDSFDDVLRAVWYGIDGYPGIPKRWAEYEPWLDRGGLLVLRFEDVIADLEVAASAILDYAHSITPAYPVLQRGRINSAFVDTNAAEMAESARDTGSSATFRKGVSGEWRQYQDVIPEWSTARALESSYSQHAPSLVTT